MARFVVNGAVLTSWAGNNNTYLIGVGTGAGAAHRDCTLTIDAPAIDSTVYAAALANRSVITGLRSATVAMAGRWNPAYNCSDISLTFGNGYAANLYSFSINFAWEVQDQTVATGSTISSRSYLPGLLTCTGSYQCYVDDTTAVSLPGGSTTGSATFELVGEASTPHTLSGTIVTTNLGETLTVGNMPVANYSFQFDGAVTAAGDADGTGSWAASPFKYWIDSASGVIGTPAAGSLVITAASGRTYTASAFPSSIALAATVGQELTVNVGAQISGDITVG